MSVLEIPLWRNAPFIRLLLPLSAGIFIEYYFGFSATAIRVVFCVSAILLFSFPYLRSRLQFHYYQLTGLAINVLFVSTGCLLLYYKDITHRENWFGHHLIEDGQLLVRLEEPLSEKARSYKTIASVSSVISKNTTSIARGKLIIYFSKDAFTAELKPGFEILIMKNPVGISATGNPGAFDYRKYMALQGIYHQVYLTSADYKIIRKGKPSYLKQFLFSSTEQILLIIRRYIKGKKEAGLAEALLIGYKDDLDKTLLQSYSTTGVVHVIAISGLHLGLIYWLLAAVLKPLGRRRRLRLLKSIIIIASLWIFSVLAGASPSVLRSALMFSFIVVGEAGGRKSSIYNSLAASAFLLLCFNPFWLWDAGFQLSYIAVLSLVIFMKPVYNCMYVKNGMLDAIWNLTSVTLAAQVLTLPLCIYLFHQFPIFFLLTNLLAIPLSSVILLGEIFLCLLSYFPAVAVPFGQLLGWLIRMMNRFVEHIERMPFSSIKEMLISLPVVFLMYCVIISIAIWILNGKKKAMFVGLCTLVALTTLHSGECYMATKQQRLVVYNVKGKAVEIINGRKSILLADAVVIKDEIAALYILQPSLVSQRIQERKYVTTLCAVSSFSIARKKITVLQKDITAGTKAMNTDILIITGNPVLDVTQLLSKIQFSILVIDGSNSYHKINKWKKDCSAFQIPYWDVAEKGAFILNLN